VDRCQGLDEAGNKEVANRRAQRERWSSVHDQKSVAPSRWPLQFQAAGSSLGHRMLTVEFAMRPKASGAPYFDHVTVSTVRRMPLFRREQILPIANCIRGRACSTMAGDTEATAPAVAGFSKSG